MAELARLGVAVLAAGRSERFGEEDKLCADFRGKALGEHVCHILSDIAAPVRFVVTASLEHPCVASWKANDFSVTVNPDAAEGMGTSVATAARIARRADMDHLLIALADMPLVPNAHYSKLIELALDQGASAILASSNGDARMPPAIFGRDHFDALADLRGDAGARGILDQGAAVTCSPEWLIDIDTPGALSTLG